jgi:hypothetical protein
MATVLEAYNTEEQHSVVSFCGQKNINKEMFPVYGGKCLSRKAVNNWIEKFSQGRSKIADIGPEATVHRVEVLIRADRSEATALACSHDLAYSIMRDRFKSRKVCASWMPRDLMG